MTHKKIISWVSIMNKELLLRNIYNKSGFCIQKTLKQCCVSVASLEKPASVGYRFMKFYSQSFRIAHTAKKLWRWWNSADSWPTVTFWCNVQNGFYNSRLNLFLLATINSFQRDLIDFKLKCDIRTRSYITSNFLCARTRLIITLSIHKSHQMSMNR